jgi:hypothetical protein
MKTTILFVTTILISFAAAIAQDSKKTEQVIGSGVVKSEKRDVEKFDAVTLKGSADVFITVGEKTEVTVTADDNILPYVTTEVEENTLVISTKPHTSLHYKELKVFITTPDLSAIKLDGSGDIEVEGLKGDSFKIDVNGCGDVAAKGQVQKLDCLIKGSGDLALGDLEAKAVNIKIAGSGDAKINAVESLQAKISGSGDIAYKAHDKLKIVKKILGSGEINKIQ